MMFSRIGGRDTSDSSGDSYNVQLLRDIKEISRALYLQNAQPKALMSPSEVRSKSVGKTRPSDSKPHPSRRNQNNNLLQKDKKSSSVWNWKKPLKALAHIGQHRFNICFILHVHSIEGLPSNFDGSSLVVLWKRKDEILSTQPSRVSGGTAEFEETLMHRCSVYGSRSGLHNSAKYEVKLFLIHASTVGPPGLDLGKHWVDLTRLLPLSLGELEGGKGTGKWTTSFKLSGLANGATLNVSFGYSVIKDAFSNSHGNVNASSHPSNGSGMPRRVGSGPSNLDYLSSQPDEAMICHQVLPNLSLELSKSIDFLYQKLNEGKLQSSRGIDVLSESLEKPKPGLDCESSENFEFAVIEKGIEICEQEEFKLEENAILDVDSSTVETIDVNDILRVEDTALGKETKSIDQVVVDDQRNEESSVSSKQSMLVESESVFSSKDFPESLDFDSSLTIEEFLEQDNFLEVESNYKASKLSKKSLSLDDITESVANDFLSMLGLELHSSALASDSEPDSPRERLLREFEKEALASGSFFLDFDGGMEEEESCLIAPIISHHEDRCEDFSFSSTTQNVEDQNESKNQLLRNRRKAKALEDLETEALMREWGLNENVFQNSPRVHSDGFGSPIELPLEEPLGLPPLGDGFGPFVRTKSGGYIRSMNPFLFKCSKNASNLVMQVSVPVVLPAELGLDIIEILQSMASIGIQELSSQIDALMPLENITGKIIQQLVDDSVAKTLMFESKAATDHGSLFQQDLFYSGKEIKGFQFDKLMSGLVGDDMFSGYIPLEALAPLAMDRIEALSIEGLRIQCGMSDQDAPSSLNPESNNYACDVAELIGSSVTLDEWSRLDAGIISDADETKELTLKILSAHHAKCIDFVSGALTNVSGDKIKHGFLGDKITVAFTVLLRDSLRNYEPVGATMLALIQVQRVSLSAKQNMFCTVEKSEGVDKESGMPLWSISEVHLAGLKTKPGRDQPWGTKAQQQSGTRWLLASGINKAGKLRSSKSNAIIVSNPRREVLPEDIFWSITSNIHGGETSRKQMATGFPASRNPNIIFQNGTVDKC